MEKHIMDLAIDRKVIIKEVMEDDVCQKHIYASQYYYLELDTARRLRDLAIISEESEENIRKRLIFIERWNTYGKYYRNILKEKNGWKTF